MIYSITGELVYADPNMAAVNVNGIAFQCDISLNTFQHLGSNGSTVTLYTYMNFKQDGVDLLGFYDRSEVDAFKMHNWDRPPSPPRPGSRPAPPGFAPPRARSRCAAHLHHGLPVSPAPTPGSRRASGTSLPPPGETGGQSIQPTEAIQAV